MDVYTLLYLKWVTYKDLLQQHRDLLKVLSRLWEWDVWGEWIHVAARLGSSAVRLKLLHY